jgi:hypothetical protein
MGAVRDHEVWHGTRLMIAQNIVTAHRGMIEYTSEVGRGTTFRVQFAVKRELMQLGRLFLFRGAHAAHDSSANFRHEVEIQGFRRAIRGAVVYEDYDKKMFRRSSTRITQVPKRRMIAQANRRMSMPVPGTESVCTSRFCTSRMASENFRSSALDFQLPITPDKVATVWINRPVHG